MLRSLVVWLDTEVQVRKHFENCEGTASLSQGSVWLVWFYDSLAI